MKLRNKKTGEIVAIDYIAVSRSAFDIEDGRTGKELAKNVETMPLCYSGIKELNEEWEDYKPAEPLIKDEKIRNAVRAWAEATGTTSVGYWGGELESEQNDSKIEFDDIAVVELGDNYTIAELCGEEEE